MTFTRFQAPPQRLTPGFASPPQPLGPLRAPLGPFAPTRFDENHNFQHIFCLPVVKCHTRTTILLKKPGERKGKQKGPKAPETTKIGPPGKKMPQKSSQVGRETHETAPTNRRGEANLGPRGHRDRQNKHRNTPEDKQKGKKEPKCTKPANSGSLRGRPKFRFHTTFQAIQLSAVYLVQSHSNVVLY